MLLSEPLTPLSEVLRHPPTVAQAADGREGRSDTKPSMDASHFLDVGPPPFRKRSGVLIGADKDPDEGHDARENSDERCEH
jgi:hypothetical protein